MTFSKKLGDSCLGDPDFPALFVIQQMCSARDRQTDRDRDRRQDTTDRQTDKQTDSQASRQAGRLTDSRAQTSKEHLPPFTHAL